MNEYELQYDNGTHRGTTCGNTLAQAIEKLETKVGPNWREHTRAFWWNGEYLEKVELPEETKAVRKFLVVVSRDGQTTNAVEFEAESVSHATWKAIDLGLLGGDATGFKVEQIRA